MSFQLSVSVPGDRRLRAKNTFHLLKDRLERSNGTIISSLVTLTICFAMGFYSEAGATGGKNLGA